MALAAGIQRCAKTWGSIMMIALFAIDMTPYRFSTRGKADANFELSAGKDYEKNSWKSERYPSDFNDKAQYYVATGQGVVSQVREMNLQDGLAEAAALNEPVDLDIEYGLRELLSEIGEVRAPGTPPSPKSPDSPNSPNTPNSPNAPNSPPAPRPKPGSPNVPGMPRTEYGHLIPEQPTAPGAPNAPNQPEAPEARPPVVPVEAPVPPQSDASIILIEKSARMAVEGLISEFTVDVGRQTRGFAFQMPERPSCYESTDSADANVPFPDGDLRIPDDAASFVIPEPGVQKVELSHPLLCSTNRPLVIVMEHVDSARSTFRSTASSAMPQTCPLRIVQDSSTNDLIQRQIIPSAPNAESEDIVAQIFGGKFDEVSGKYKVLTHRFSQPHTLVMHFLVKLGQINPLSLLQSSKSMLKEEDGYKLILPLSDQLGAQVETEHVSNTVDMMPANVRSVERPSHLSKFGEKMAAMRRFARY